MGDVPRLNGSHICWKWGDGELKIGKTLEKIGLNRQNLSLYVESSRELLQRDGLFIKW